MTREQIVRWLGRPLTPTEDTNFDSYINIAKSYLESLLCTDVFPVLSGNPPVPEVSARVYEARNGYSTLFTDYFSGNITVTINGRTRTDFTQKFFDNRNTSFKNSLVFNCKFRCNDEVTISAAWGFNPLPDDLGKLLAQLFAVASKPYTPAGDIKSKRVEDFAITFGDRSDVEVLVSTNSLVIQKYSLCSIDNIRHGKVCRLWI